MVFKQQGPLALELCHDGWGAGARVDTEAAGKIERGSGAFDTVEPQATVHQLHQVPADRQPQAGAAETTRRRIVGLRKCFEYCPLPVHRDADSGIADGKAEDYRSGSAFLDRHRHFYFATVGKLDRIPEQIGEHLTKPYGIADDSVRDILRHRDDDLQPFLVGQHRLRAGRFENQGWQREGQFFKVQLAGFDFGKIKDVVDNRQQRLGRGLDGLQIVSLLVVQLRIQRQVGHPDDAVHRCPNLVAHVGQESATGAVGGFRRFLG